MKITAQNRKHYISLRKMCQAIVKYNEFRNEESEQFLVRRDMFIRIKLTLEEMA